MKDINKRLVEVECILKKLDDYYIGKIPQEIWEYISKNKYKDYVFEYDNNKSLVEQNLNIDTISILTYLNMKYLLNENQSKEMEKLLRNDEKIAEEEKRKRYNVDDIFKNRKENKKQKDSLVEIKMGKWYEKLFSFFKNMFNK